jgi:DNA-binding transcriptional LysR family regulator
VDWTDPNRAPDQTARRARLSHRRQNQQHGRAAIELAVSPPVVSKAISELEHALGFRLLDCSPQGCRANELWAGGD